MTSGKIWGALIGYWLFGPLGLFLGWWLWGKISEARPLNGTGFSLFGGRGTGTQATYFRTTFQVMGHVAKADGRVCEREISHARAVMSRMGLNESLKRQAMGYFNEGKQPDFDLSDALTKLKAACGWHVVLMQMFVQIQMQAAQADGKIDRDQEAVLKRISEALGVSGGNYQQAHGQGWGGQSSSGYRQRRTSSGQGYYGGSGLSQAYTTLGVKADVTKVELKKAYRRLMSEYHPDKLMSKGLPDSMIKVATEKTQEIKAAYEQVCAAKGWA
jgi:DnaJ like chaperone protein